MKLAKYIRLSLQDDDWQVNDKAESNSVVNQRALLNGYIQAHKELCSAEILEFVDDGLSGTNFDRPGFQSLMDQARQGGIDCVIVKDFSRLGRNYIETGDYLEQVFPFLGIRFIAVNEGYDSKDKPYGTAGDLDLGIRNLINDMYSRDLSQRVKIAKEQYAKRGDCIAAYPIYGYQKFSENRRKLVVDPVAAETVRLTFDFALQGFSATEIAQELTRRQISVPSQRKRELGATRTTWSKRREVCQWNTAMVTTILREERYTGKMIAMRRKRYEVGNPNTQLQQKKDWIVVEGAFEAIISQDTFQKVQDLFPKKPAREKNSHSTPLPFARKVHCGVCGLALHRGKDSRLTYYCENCTNGGRVHEDELIRTVMAGLQLQKSFFQLWEHSCLDQAQGKSRQERKTSMQRNRIQSLIDKMRTQKCEIFMKRESGRISQQEYDAACAKCNGEIAALEGKLKAIEMQAQAPDNLHPSFEKVLRAVDPAEPLTRDMVEKLIQDIIVYKDGRLEIIWTYGDELEAALAQFHLSEERNVT